MSTTGSPAPTVASTFRRRPAVRAPVDERAESLERSGERLLVRADDVAAQAHRLEKRLRRVLAVADVDEHRPGEPVGEHLSHHRHGIVARRPRPSAAASFAPPAFDSRMRASSVGRDARQAARQSPVRSATATMRASSPNRSTM